MKRPSPVRVFSGFPHQGDLVFFNWNMRLLDGLAVHPWSCLSDFARRNVSTNCDIVKHSDSSSISLRISQYRAHRSSLASGRVLSDRGQQPSEFVFLSRRRKVINANKTASIARTPSAGSGFILPKCFRDEQNRPMDWRQIWDSLDFRSGNSTDSNFRICSSNFPVIGFLRSMSTFLQHSGYPARPC